jgi:membrane protein
MKKPIFGLKRRFTLLRATISSFTENKVFKLSAALSYYTLFSLPPLLIIIIGISGIFFGKDAVSGQLFDQIQGIIGSEAALQIQAAIKTLELSGQNFFATLIGFLILIFSASTLFAEIQDSMNQIWGIKAKRKMGFIKFLKNRLVAFSMILGVGLLLILGLIIDTMLDLLTQRLAQIFSLKLILMFQMVNWALLFVIMTLFFTAIFKSLPDGYVHLRDCFIGALLTSILFMLGKFGISFYLTHSPVSSLYGAAGSLILMLLWVYYSAIILYFGVTFTKEYALYKGHDIKPNSYAVKYQKQIIPDA